MWCIFMGTYKNTKQNQLFNIFCGKMVVGGFHPRVLVATVSSEVGVNHRNAQGILNMEMLESISASRQRQCRASRDGESSWFFVVAGVKSYIMLFKRIEASYKSAVLSEDDEDMQDLTRAYNNTIHTPIKKATLFDK